MGSLLRSQNLRAVLLALLIGIGLSSGPRGRAGFRRDEVECEETFAKLKACCAEVLLEHVSCEFVEGCEYNEYPDLSTAESKCIRELSCSAIRAATICERIAQRVQNPGNVSPAVCP